MVWKQSRLWGPLFPPSTNSNPRPRSCNYNKQQGKDKCLAQFPHGLGLCCLPWVFSVLTTRCCHHVGEEKESWPRLEGRKRKEEERPHLCTLRLFSWELHLLVTGQSQAGLPLRGDASSGPQIIGETAEGREMLDDREAKRGFDFLLLDISMTFYVVELMKSF